MSLDAKNMTQGGQVIKYMLNMFIQITNIVVFWSSIAGVISFFAYLIIVMKWVTFKNGFFYFYIKHVVLMFKKDPNKASKYEYAVNVLSNGKLIEKKLTAAKIVDNPYFFECGEILKVNSVIALGIGIAVFIGTALLAFYYLGKKGAQQRKDDLIGGRYLAKSVKEVNKYIKDRGQLSHLKIGDLHIVKDSEIQNFGVHGTVGTGKSTIINSFLEQVRASNQRATIYDKGNNFIKLFYREGKDVILNPIDARCPRWDLWLECLDKADFESFALPLVPDSKGDPFWNMAARRLFVATAEKMRGDADRSIKKLLDKLLSYSLDDLKTYVENTDASSLVEGSVEKTAATIRVVLGVYVNSLRYCEHLDNAKGEPFAIREWVHKADEDSWIFISSDGRVQAALKPLITTWLNLLMQSVLSLSPSRTRRIWTVLDELASLDKLPKLQDYMQEARKFGGVTFISIQNFPQVEDVYGPKSASAIWDLCNTVVYFRSPSSKVAEWVQKEIGEIHKNKFQDQYSYGVETIRDGVNFSKNENREKIVSYSDIQRLDDLECYVSLKGNYPVTKLKIEYKAFPILNEIGLMERQDIDVSKIKLEPENNDDELIEQLVNQKSDTKKDNQNSNSGSEQVSNANTENDGYEKTMKKEELINVLNKGKEPEKQMDKRIEDNPYSNEANIVKKEKSKDTVDFSSFGNF